jgi:methyl-accepting chemotaxis protein
MSIKNKIRIVVLSAVIIIFVSALTIISYRNKHIVIEDAKNLTDAYAREYANLSTTRLNVDFGIVNTLINSFSGYKELNKEQRSAIYSPILRKVLDENPEFTSVWLHWELSAVDKTYKKTYGRVRSNYFKYGNELRLQGDTLETTGDNTKGTYYKIKTNPSETITEPYFYSYTKNETDKVLESSICSPIIDNGKFVGLVGVDVELGKFQAMTNKIKPFDNSYAFLVSNDGSFISHPENSYINKTIIDYFGDAAEKEKLNEKIKNGKAFSFIRTDENGKSSYVSFAPVYAGKTHTPWALGVVVPLDVIVAKAQQNFLLSILIGLIGLIILSVIIGIISRRISNPIVKITESLKKLDKGITDESIKLNVSSSGEIFDMAHSVNTLIESLEAKAVFAKQVGEGFLDANLNLLSKEDRLGNSLVEMQKKLVIANKEEEKRKDEDAKTNWFNQGVAKFGQILRNNEDINEFSYQLISNLVKYLNANQGSIFILNDESGDKDKSYLELTAAFAYDRKKYIDKHLNIGEGLVGACYLEKESIYMTDIPDNYVNITSGLGDSNPRSLLIVPLKFNDVVEGVIEIASFKTYEKYQIHFAEQIAEHAASSISSLKINRHTNFLLEQSQLQAQKLREQEEELRQNIEEISTAREEMERKEKQMKEIIIKLSTKKETEREINEKPFSLKKNEVFI